VAAAAAGAAAAAAAAGSGSESVRGEVENILVNLYSDGIFQEKR